jgi:hypothetical protein
VSRDRFADARAVADAVLFEGYALYPYRASAPKNQLRWQFGVLAPRGWSEAGGGDAWWQETQCLVRTDDLGTPGRGPSLPRLDGVRLQGRLRLLQLRRRQIHRAAPPLPWDEGELREIDFGGAIADGEQTMPFHLAGDTETKATDDGAPITWESWPVAGAVRVVAEPVVADQPLARLRIRVENLTAWLAPDAPRDEALRASLLAVHLVLGVTGGTFVSLLDPPPWAAAAAAACRNTRTYPVLAGPAGRHDLVLSAPIILYDHPAVAPESPGDLFDATEIDEILTLRILTLTDEEKREARATDPRVAALLDRAERLTPSDLARLHGARRELRPGGASAPLSVQIAGVAVGPGSRVRLRPGARRTDAQDMFLVGMTATVEAVLRDVDDRSCLAVAIDGDPATELLSWHGRFHYFYPDEVEPLVEAQSEAHG